jgi:signal transduction histidine kinase
VEREILIRRDSSSEPLAETNALDARILITDDSSDSRALLKLRLSVAGYHQIEMASTASEAYDLLGMNDPSRHADDCFDLILLDISMADVDGITACRRIKSEPRFAHIPIIMVTGHNESSLLDEAFQAGASDYITKPLNRVELLARVRSALALKQESEERARANSELAQKNQALNRALNEKDQILSTATHELRSPLTSIMAVVDHMLQSPDKVGQLSDAQRRYLTTVQKGSRRLNDLIGDLLDTSRIAAGKLQLMPVEFDVSGEVHEAVESMRTVIDDKQLAVDVEIEPGLPALKADKLRIGQVLANLLTNACKYSPDGSRVTISARNSGKGVQIDVSDQGIGIPPEDQSMLFTKFFRASNAAKSGVPGIGLGLFISSHIIEAHGGEIWVSSDGVHGSTFSFTLPLGTMPADTPPRSVYL